MVYFKDNEWHIVTEKVLYKQDGEELENFVGQEGKEWWYGITDLHENIVILGFDDIEEATPNQLTRLDEINNLNIGDGHSGVVREYVIDGKFPDLPNHILKDLQFTKMFQIMLGVE